MPFAEFSSRLAAIEMSQAEFARRGGFAAMTVSRWRTKGSVPSYAAAILALLEERRQIAMQLLR